MTGWGSQKNLNQDSDDWCTKNEDKKDDKTDDKVRLKSGC